MKNRKAVKPEDMIAGNWYADMPTSKIESGYVSFLRFEEYNDGLVFDKIVNDTGYSKFDYDKIIFGDTRFYEHNEEDIEYLKELGEIK